jgi:ribosomal protein L31
MSTPHLACRRTSCIAVALVVAVALVCALASHPAYAGTKRGSAACGTALVFGKKYTVSAASAVCPASLRVAPAVIRLGLAKLSKGASSVSFAAAGGLTCKANKAGGACRAAGKPLSFSWMPPKVRDGDIMGAW